MLRGMKTRAQGILMAHSDERGIITIIRQGKYLLWYNGQLSARKNDDTDTSLGFSSHTSLW